MRNLLLLIFAVLAGLTACRKELVVTTEPYKPPYRISGLANIKYELSPFVARPFNFYDKDLNIIYERGPQKLVFLEVTGAPAGMVTSLSAVSGYPAYDTKLILRDTGLAAGVYALNAKLKSDGDAAVDFPFTITVTGDASCINYYTQKNYRATRSCDSAGTYPVRIIRAGTGEDTVRIQNFQNTGTDLKVVISCFPAHIFIPSQNIGGTIYSGSGEVYLDPYYYPGAPYIALYMEEKGSSGYMLSCKYTLSF